MNETVYQKAQANDIYLLNHFLKCNQQGSASRGDLNYIARRQNAIVGSARLIKVDSSNDELNYWLRGVYVVEEERHQGIATRLLEYLHRDLSKESIVVPNPLHCYAFPLSHLERFYQNLGYEYCEMKSLPDALGQRYRQAQKTGKNWLCMVKTID